MRARPSDPSSGPSTQIEARILRTSSYGAVGLPRPRGSMTTSCGDGNSTRAPRAERMSAIVRISATRGTLRMREGLSPRSAAAMIGRAAFLAPPILTVPLSRLPPRTTILSIAAALACPVPPGPTPRTRQTRPTSAPTTSRSIPA